MNLSAEPLLITLKLREGPAKALASRLSTKFHLDAKFYSPFSGGQMMPGSSHVHTQAFSGQRLLVLQVPGGWCCKYQGVGAASTQAFSAQHLLVLQEGTWVRDCPTISHGVWFECEVEEGTCVCNCPTISHDVWFECEVEVPDNHDHLVLILQTSQNGLLFFM